MSSSESHSAGPPDGYVLHPLSAIDGILIYVTRSGEHVGTYFGKTEAAATAAVASDLLDSSEATA
jgi:hypothetical protein